jgi:DNA-binding NarL/FixJ family response regulator
MPEKWRTLALACRVWSSRILALRYPFAARDTARAGKFEIPNLNYKFSFGHPGHVQRSIVWRTLVREQKPAATILIADDHQLLADACKTLLEPEFQVVGIVTDGRRLIAAAAELNPDVIVLDIYMPHLNGLDAGSQVKQKRPGVKLVFLTMTMEAEVAAEAFRRGASGYVLKQSAGDELVFAIRKVNQGASYLSPLIARETVTYLLNQGETFSEEKRITKRQSEILQLLAEGMSMKEVANVIDVKPGTVAFHKYRMMETLNVKTNAELLEYAIKRHMTPA